MKVLSKIMIALVAVSLIASCKGKPEGEAAKTGDASKTVATAPASAQQYNVKSGTIYWTGTKVGGQHTGTFAIQKGDLATTGGKLSSGSFGIDLTSLKVTDELPEDKKGQLAGHLMSPDFFDVKANPTGMFSIVAVEPLSGNEQANYTIKGNLTLKGVTKSVSIPAFVNVMTDKVTAVTPKFVINRTDWNIKYGSGNFFKELTADKVISDEVSLSIELEATLQ